MTVSLAIAETIQRVDRVYFFDLLGAAGGCLVLIPLLNILGGPGVVLGAAAIFAASSAVWFGLVGSIRGRVGGVAAALGLVLLLTVNPRAGWIDIASAKGRQLRDEVFFQWNSFSRVAVAPEKPGGALQIIIDGDASTGLPTFDLDHLPDNERETLLGQGAGFAYQLRPASKTLIIGAGGGYDIARAIASGSRDVTGVEINPIIAQTIMRGRFRHITRGLYLRPDVRIVVEDGRSFVRRTPEQYQVILATLVDTWASTAAGAFALSENNLYTVEAFEDYLKKLTPDGVLSFTRWGFPTPRESLRLVGLAQKALENLGEKEAWRHVAVVREGTRQMLEGFGALDTILIGRKPFPAADLDRLRAFAARSRFEILYLPGDPPANAFHELLTTRDRASFFARYPYDVSPVVDDRPFFFYTVQASDAFGFRQRDGTEAADVKINLAVPTLFRLLGVSLLAVLVILLLPPLALGSRLPREPGIPVFLVYFLCLGAGYILIQVGLIQKLVLFLGRPTYSLTVVIFSMLVSSGLGSFFSRRVVDGRDSALRWVLFTVSGAVVLLAVIAGPVTTAGVAWPMPLKLLTAVLLVAPAGFLMGMPFPSGLARLERWHAPSVRWAWSLNAAASVLGSAAAIGLAIYLGLRATLVAGALLYTVAAFSVRARPRLPAA
jgi:SAM-dependent methyltransferase